MSFSALPRDILDLISFQVGFVDNEDGSYSRPGNPIVLDFKSLSQLCLVCRNLLPSALRALYHSPFSLSTDDLLPLAFDIRPTTNFRLRDSLEANHNRLGRLVRSTVGISRWFNDFLVNEEGSQGGGTALSDAARWYVDVLEACPLISHLEFNICTQPMIRAVSRSIKKALPTIESIMFFSETNTSSSRATLSTIYKALGPLFQKPLRMVDATVLAMTKKGTRSDDLSFPMKVDRIQMRTEAKNFSSILHLLPSSSTPHPLRQLALHLEFRPNPSDFHLLADRVGANLETLDLALTENITSARLSPYGRYHEGLHLAHDSLLPFVSLKKLDICRVKGPSLALLQNLAIRSPLLERISFEECCWVDDPARLSNAPGVIFPEQQIVACLLKFKNLRYVHFGVLPTTDRSVYQDLEKNMEEKGIEVKFEVCRED